ncbi:MAG: amidase [Rhodospirillaceae bacterium]
MSKTPYDPKTANLLAFAPNVPKFVDGADTPRAYLERCLETIAAREPEVKAFVATNVEGARAAADASTARYKAGRPASPIDGMPVGIKDVVDTHDMPMEAGSPIMKANRPLTDAPSVYWLRRGGAAVVGKTVTTEFAFSTPGPTRNPWDTDRTAGGSSSGSGAAVGARMLPVTTGTQVRASVLRPAAYSGVYALKPSHGGINCTGGFPSPASINHLGVLAGSLWDMWATAYYLSQTAGGDCGFRSLPGEPGLPAARRPKRIIRLDTAGWAETTAPTRAAYEAFLDMLAARDVQIVGRKDDPAVEAFEREVAAILEVSTAILTWEGRYPLQQFYDRHRDQMGKTAADRMAAAEAMTPADYHRALDRQARIRAMYEALAAQCDALITLNAPCPAPVGIPVGSPVYGDLSSITWAPALNLPLLAVDNMPMGIQLLGGYYRDWELTATGHWLVHLALRGEG